MELVQSFSSSALAELQHFLMHCEFIPFAVGAPFIILFLFFFKLEF